MINESSIKKINDIIIKNYSPDKIIIFGSYAHGTPTENSDLDILIIKDTRLPRIKRTNDLRKHFRGLKIPLDILVYTHKEINKYKNVKTSFIYDVIKNGRIVYER